MYNIPKILMCVKKGDKMEHSFNIELAKEYGILEAILLKNIWFWIEKNRANEKNFYDGTYWTYNSTRAFNELFPYVSEKSIKRALRGLKEKGIIKTGNYNKSSYDRTLWYAFTDLGLSIVTNRTMEENKSYNGREQNELTIPDINTDNKTTDIKTDVEKEKNAEIVKCYEDNIGLITPATAEILFSYNDIDYNMIIKAIKIASVNNKRSCKYIQGILNSWIKKGYKVLADIQNEEQKQQKEKAEAEHSETQEERIARLKREWGIEDED